MNKMYIVMITLCTMHTVIFAEDPNKKIVLTHSLLAVADGTFFNANLIEWILKYRRGIMDILEGERDKNNNKVGKYTFNGEKCNALDLQHAETLSINQTPERKKELHTILAHAKQDLIILSSQFRDIARGSQKISAALIQKSCEQRNRMDSILLIWGDMENPSEQEENIIFEKHVTDFNAFAHFSTDLYNFLTDLINSCPKAQAQYKARIQKFNKVKDLLPESITEKTKNIDKIAFLTHVKSKYLDRLSLEQITVAKVTTLIDAFMHPKKSLDDESN